MVSKKVNNKLQTRGQLRMCPRRGRLSWKDVENGPKVLSLEDVQNGLKVLGWEDVQNGPKAGRGKRVCHVE